MIGSVVRMKWGPGKVGGGVLVVRKVKEGEIKPERLPGTRKARCRLPKDGPTIGRQVGIVRQSDTREKWGGTPPWDFLIVTIPGHC